MEAGHRCAIPACRQPTVEIAHIVPWEQVREHKFDNLIVLCANCHIRFGRGEIDRPSMKQYKANLSVLTGRYGDLEQRVLRFFARRPEEDEIELPERLDILLMYLLEDGLLEGGRLGRSYTMTINYGGDKDDLDLPSRPTTEIYRLTDKGREFITRWLSAKKLE